ENQNLPGFITVNPTPNVGGPRNYSNAFLPSVYQGTALGRAGQPAARSKFRYISSEHLDAGAQKRQFDFLQELNRDQAAQAPGDGELNAAINAYELAFRMQTHAPGMTDLSNESKETQKLYGIGEAETDDFGRQCLMARRFAEAGVRFV